MMLVALFAYALEPFVGIDRAYVAAWGVILAIAGALAGLVYLIVNGG